MNEPAQPDPLSPPGLDPGEPLPNLRALFQGVELAGRADVFPVLAERVHFDHAAVSPLPKPVADAMRRYVDAWSMRGPQGWAYSRLDALRRLGAELVGASASEIAIVPNTSTGLSIVAAGLDLRAGDVVVTTEVEFPANRHGWEARRDLGLEVVLVPPSAGRGSRGPRLVIDDDIVAAMRRSFRRTGTSLLAISHVQFETGQRHDLARLAEEAHRLGGLICVDAIQSLGQAPFRADWGVDFASADGHKWMLGPEGAGIFYVASRHLERLRPPVVGWFNFEGFEDFDRHDLKWASGARRYEAGCPPMGGVVGLSAALELLLSQGIERIEARVQALAKTIAEGARQSGLTVVSPHEAGRGSGIVAIDTAPRGAPQSLHQHLRRAGIHGAVRRGLLRLSPHFYNTPEQAERVVAEMRSWRP